MPLLLSSVNSPFEFAMHLKLSKISFFKSQFMRRLSNHVTLLLSDEDSNVLESCVQLCMFSHLYMTFLFGFNSTPQLRLGAGKTIFRSPVLKNIETFIWRDFLSCFWMVY